MPLAHLETGGIARCLAQIAERPADHVDAFFEVVTEGRVAGRLRALDPGWRIERGLAVRLLRDGRCWLASGDEISPELFARAIARVARARPGAVAPPPRSLRAGEVTVAVEEELATFARSVEEAIQRRHAAFPIRWDLRSHSRWTRVVGAMLSPEPQHERFYSCAVSTSRGEWGALATTLDESRAEAVAESLTCCFRAHRALPPTRGSLDLVLAPPAAAVVLHEAVAHALETDTLALTGDPQAAIGVRLGGEQLDVLDDPTGADESVRRTVDDEGMPVVRRWLVRGGTVEQPLADLSAASGSERLIAGAARRGSRHLAPVPRSTHLELLPGSRSAEELRSDCGEGLWVQEFSRGKLDPISGVMTLEFPYARRIAGGELRGLVGPGRVRGPLVELLASVREIGGESRPAGAGWCAKGGHRLPVWATAPPLLMEAVEVTP